MKKEPFIVSYIGIGRDNAVTRQQLKLMTGLSDRENRKLIEQARHNGYAIANLQDGKGYYIPNEARDIKAQLRQNKSRADSILAQQKYLQRALRKCKTQNKAVGG